MNIDTRRADARGALRAAGWSDDDVLAVIPIVPPKSYIRFEFNGISPSGKTKRWLVLTKDVNPINLGAIAWQSGWRCYSFYPNVNTVFEKACLRDIANFCEEKTTEHRAAIANRKSEIDNA